MYPARKQLLTSGRLSSTVISQPCSRRWGGGGATTSDPALIDVARGMRDMVAEARADRHDLADKREDEWHACTIREKMVVPSLTGC
jgi:hypothetical protein